MHKMKARPDRGEGDKEAAVMDGNGADGETPGAAVPGRESPDSSAEDCSTPRW